MSQVHGFSRKAIASTDLVPCADLQLECEAPATASIQLHPTARPATEECTGNSVILSSLKITVLCYFK